MKRPAVLRHAGILGHWKEYPEGSVERAKALGLEVLFTFKHVETTRHLWETEKQLVERERPWVILRLPSRGAFIEAVTGHPESEADAIIELGPYEIGNGKAGPGRGNKTDNNIIRLRHQGTHPAYLLARLDRDKHTALAARVRAGELSAYAAGRLAGFKNCQRKTPLEQLEHWWAKASPDERLTFLQRHNESGNDTDNESGSAFTCGISDLGNVRSVDPSSLLRE